MAETYTVRLLFSEEEMTDEEYGAIIGEIEKFDAVEIEKETRDSAIIGISNSPRSECRGLGRSRD